MSYQRQVPARSVRRFGTVSVAVGTVLVTLLSVIAVAFAPLTASAAVDDLPSLRVKVRSITLDGYTGNIVVKARVKCTQQVTGVGSASWGMRAVQELRARDSTSIRCNGEAYRSVLTLDPKAGRFHPGLVNLTQRETARGSMVVEVGVSNFDTVI